MIYSRQRINQLLALAKAQRSRAARLLRHARTSRAASRTAFAAAAFADTFGVPSSQWRPESPGAQGSALPRHGLQTSVRNKLRFWAKAGASSQLLQWISKGVTLPFQS